MAVKTESKCIGQASSIRHTHLFEEAVYQSSSASMARMEPRASCEGSVRPVVESTPSPPQQPQPWTRGPYGTQARERGAAEAQEERAAEAQEEHAAEARAAEEQEGQRREAYLSKRRRGRLERVRSVVGARRSVWRWGQPGGRRSGLAARRAAECGRRDERHSEWQRRLEQLGWAK
jgi:hypothetical protein